MTEHHCGESTMARIARGRSQIDLRVNLYNDPEGEPYATDVLLSECFPDDPEETAAARNALVLQGQYWCGGGAAPLIFIALSQGGK